MTALAAHVHDLSGLTTLEWGIVIGSGVFVAWVLWRAIRLTLDPGETDPGHIKRSILEEGPPPRVDDGA